jgi:hypothetical protein
MRATKLQMRKTREAQDAPMWANAKAMKTYKSLKDGKRKRFCAIANSSKDVSSRECPG